MSAKTVQWLFENATRRYSGSKLMLLVSIGWILNDGEAGAAITLSTLLKRNGLDEHSRTHLIKMLKDLEKDGTLIITRTRTSSQKNEPNRYQIPLNPALYPVEGSSETATSETVTTPESGSGSDTPPSSGTATTPVADPPLPVVANPAPLNGDSKGLINGFNNNKSPAAADAEPPATRPKKPTTPAEASRIWTNVTGMMAIPGGIDEQDQVLAKILDLADKYGPDTECYLRPFWQALTLAKNKQQRAYSRTSTYWLTTWAIGDEIPELILSQLRGRSELPSELAEYIKTHNPAGPAIKKAGGQGLTKEQLEAEYQRVKGAKQ